jgi:DNA-binding protein HU-beta
MTKKELIYAVADRAQMTRIAAERAVEATFDAITAELQKGGEVKISGFGQFRVSKLVERHGRNPQTGSPMKIKPSKRPRFSPGKLLREAVNS